jgi:hypothetical protein
MLYLTHTPTTIAAAITATTIPVTDTAIEALPSWRADAGSWRAWLLAHAAKMKAMSPNKQPQHQKTKHASDMWLVNDCEIAT